MSRAYLNKYENGKSQTLHARERANGQTHQSRVREYLDDLDSAGGERSPVVITVPAANAAPEAKGSMAQMMLFDQPVKVKIAEPNEVRCAVEPSAHPTQAKVAAPKMLRPALPTMTSAARATEPFTLRGMIKGCGMGLATAAALLLAYWVVA